jgi:hypothetical protein
VLWSTATIGPPAEFCSFDDLGGGPAQPTRLNDLPVFEGQRDHGRLCCLFIRALLNGDASALFDEDVPTEDHGTPSRNVLAVCLWDMCFQCRVLIQSAYLKLMVEPQSNLQCYLLHSPCDAMDRARTPHDRGLEFYSASRRSTAARSSETRIGFSR